MPPISPVPIIGHAIFMSHGLKLPTSDSWKEPDPKDQYDEGLKESKRTVPDPPPLQIPMPFFMPQHMNKPHTDSCKDIGAEFQAFHDDALNAVKFSHDLWRLQAKFKDLKVNAVTALGTPGCLDGPKLESNIKNAPSFVSWKANENASKYVDAVAKGVSDQYEKWQGKVMVPGLPWYPAFAAFPGPQAPPMPNVPVPLIACPSPMMAEILVPSKLKDAMVGALKKVKKDDPDKQHEALFDGIATALALAFTLWLPSQQVMLVLGKGPIPTFAPPYVPVGPVVMGDNIATPGHLAV